MLNANLTDDDNYDDKWPLWSLATPSELIYAYIGD